MKKATVNDYFKHQWAKLIVFVLFTAVVSFFAPLKSFQLKWLIDSKSKQEALGYMGLVFLITFTSWFFERLSRRSFTKLACGAVEQVRGQVMERVSRSTTLRATQRTFPCSPPTCVPSTTTIICPSSTSHSGAASCSVRWGCTFTSAR